MKLSIPKLFASKFSAGLLALLALFLIVGLAPQATPAQENVAQEIVGQDKSADIVPQETLSVPSIFLDQGTVSEEKPPRPPLQLRPLVIGETLTVNAKSRGIVWNGNTLHLVKIPQLEFELADEQLTAKTKVTLLTFDEAPYRAHVAIFDESGTLLGTATAGCETQRVWLGVYAMTWREISFDFGKSKAYANAKFFSVAISDHEIKTPDQWQK